MSKYINEKLSDKLNFIVGDKATIVCKTIARIFTAGPDESWIDSDLVGYLCLVFDRSTKASYIRVYHMEEFKLLFEMALYPNFHTQYKSDKNKLFHYFEILGGFIGLSILDEGDAEILSNKIVSFSPKKEEKGSKKKDPSKKEEKVGFFDKLWGKITGKPFAEDYKIDGPTDVVHESSVKFDIKNGTFDVKSIPSEWKTLFKNAGIEKKHLLDDQYAPMIMEVLLNAYSELEKSENLSNIKASSNSAAPNNDASSAKNAPAQTVNKGGPPAPNLNLGGGGNIPQAPVLGGGPAAPVLNLNSPSAPVLNLGGGGQPKAPALDLNKPSAPVIDLNKPSAPTLDLNKPSAPMLDLNKPSAPTLDLNKPSAPSLNLNKPSAPALDISKSANLQKPAGGPGAPQLSKSENLPKPTADRGDLLSQINSGNFRLKKVQKDEKKNVVAVDIKNMPKKVEESITNTLAAAIAERRKQLMKNNYKEKEVSDWSD